MPPEGHPWLGMEGWIDAGSRRSVAACELLPAVLGRRVAEVCGQVSGSAVEAGGTGRKLGPRSQQQTSWLVEINEEFTPTLW